MRDRNIIYILHIRDCILQIEKYSRQITKAKFLKSEEKQDAILRRLEIIGEAVKNIKLSFRNKYKQIEWRKIAGLRDILIHEYFGVDTKQVWEIIKVDIPKLKIQINSIIEDNKQAVFIVDK